MTQPGKSIFMARSVVAGHPITPECWLRGLPLLSPVALAVYSTDLRDRLQKFPQPQVDQECYSVPIPRGARIDGEGLRSLPWTHKLRHDGESVFWLLVWWAIHLRPRSLSLSKIDSAMFGFLTDIDLAKGMDRRMAFMQMLANGNRTPWLDPKYQELESLFVQMAWQLTGDLY